VCSKLGILQYCEPSKFGVSVSALFLKTWKKNKGGGVVFFRATSHLFKINFCLKCSIKNLALIFPPTFSVLNLLKTHEKVINIQNVLNKRNFSLSLFRSNLHIQ
jgi:hypothetical protein